VTAGAPDRVLIRRHLIALDDAVGKLRRHRGETLERLHSDGDLLWAVERGLQICAQNVLDISILVHAYLAIDVSRLHAFLVSRLDDFVEFAGYVEKYLERQEA
jgi:uncharacterized protein YutE (UPF0331/DUF86 family)